MGLTVLWTNSFLSEIEADLADIRAAHVDIVMSYLMTSGTTSDADMQAYLDALDAAGLRAMIDVMPLGKYVVSGRPSKPLTSGELAALTAYIDQWKSHPAVWGWYADDEGGAEYPIATRQQVYDAIKAAHPAGQVFETHFTLVPGAYSPDVHDVFAADAGPGAGSSYVYLYDDQTPRGCVSKATGLVTQPDVELRQLDAFQARLVTLKAELDAAGETQYLVCVQAFGQHASGAEAWPYAMPPLGGISRMGTRARAAGWGDYGVGFFLWESSVVTNLDGVSQGPNHAALVAELAAVATLAAPLAIAPTLAAYRVTVAGEDVTELVDMDTLHRSMSERGEASATIDIPVASANEVPVNGLVRDADVEIIVDGMSEWLGQVVAVHKPKPQDLSYVLDCAGGWDTLHHCAPWCKGFVETRYDGIQEYSASWAQTLFEEMVNQGMSVSTDGEILFVVSAETKSPLFGGKDLYLHILGGMDPSACIKRVTFDWALDERAGDLMCGVDTIVTPWVNSSGAAVLYRDTAGSGSVDWTPGDSIVRQCLRFWARQQTLTTSATQEDTFQIRHLRVYIDRTTAPRVDEIVAAIDADVRPDAPAASTEAIGSALTAFMLDPFTTPADGIATALTKAAVPPLCGVIQNQLIIKNRPTAPPDPMRLWTVSEQITPGLEWGVEVDEEQSVDYVGVSYSSLDPDLSVPDGTPQIVYYPTAPPNAAARAAIIDGGDLTHTEAGVAAQQAYAYLHALASGPVVIPYVVQDASGAERPADVIRMWDWVQNVGSLDADTAGPFLVSEVEHQGHIATLTIGAAEAYAYNGPERMPTKGRYVGAHKVRSRTKQRVSFAKYWAWKYRKRKRKPAMPKKHAKYGTIHGYKWMDVEGRYR